MKNNTAKILLFQALVFFFSCSDNHKEKSNFPKFDARANANVTKGAQGVYQVPSLLAISILDSAAMPNVQAKVAASYITLGEEINTVGAEINGPLGQLIYNNDTANFKFICFAPISMVPDKEPVKCRIITLNAADMLVYNYYGRYQQLYMAYADIRLYMQQQGLRQIGEMREFYVADAATETDSKNWLTRIMVPVESVKKEK